MSPNPSPTPAPGGPQLTASFADVLKAMQGLTATAQQATTPLEAIKKTFADIGATITGTLDPLNKVRDAFTGFKDALKGLKDSVGLALPVLDRMGGAVIDVFSSMGELFGKVIPPVGRMLNAVGGFFANFTLMGGRFGDMLRNVAALGDGMAGDLVRKVAAGLAQFGTKLWEHVGPPIKAIGEFIGASFATGTALANVGVKLAGTFASGIRVAAQFGGAIAGLAASIAEGGVNALRRVFNVLDSGISAVNMNVTRFVRMVDPSAIVRWELAVDSLYATIGSVMVPVLDTFAELIRNISSGIAGATAEGKTFVAALAAGATGLIAFGAAMVALQTIMTGGLLPIIGAVVGAIGGVAVVTGALEPLFTKVGSVLSGILDVAGKALLTVAGVVLDAVMGPLQKALEYGAKLIVYFADAFTRMGPAIAAVFEVFGAVMDAVRPMQELIIGIIVEGVVLLAQAFKGLAPFIILVVEEIGSGMKIVIGWIRELLAAIGINIPEFTKAKIPEGDTDTPQAPVRQAQFGGVEEVLRKAMVASYTIGGPGGPKPEVEIAKNTNQTAAAVNDLRAQIGALIAWITNSLPDFLVKQMPMEVYGFMKKVANDGVNILRDVGVEIPGTDGKKVTAGDVYDAAKIIGNPVAAWNAGTEAVNNVSGIRVPKIQF